MDIQIVSHTLERAEERGTNEDEIKDVINRGFSIPAKYGRIGKSKVYEFKQNRLNKYYEQKRVEVFYTIEGNRIITATRLPYMFFMASGRCKMHVVYNDKTDLLYIRLDDRKQAVINRRVTEDIVLDVGENDKIVGIEILDASKHIELERLLPVKYEVSKT